MFDAVSRALGTARKTSSDSMRGGEDALERARLDHVLAAVADEERRAVGEEAVALDELELPGRERALVELARP